MQPYSIKTIGQYHNFRGLPGPSHPLISVFRIEEINKLRDDEPEHIVQDFYSIALKKNASGTLVYGQREYDFDKGSMFFIAPNQVYSIRGTRDLTHSGWLLLIHPDLFWDTQLSSKIKQFEYFGYAVNEALHLSEKEEETIVGVLRGIREECRSNIDNFSKPVIISRIETLLNYANRFYHRQFLTREKENHQILVRLEKILSNHFNKGDLASKGLPTVLDISGSLNVSPNYLSSLLKVLTGKSTQQHIQDKLIEQAKEKLAIRESSISEIAFQLGFDYPQSFSKFFKSKTNLTPSEFRQSFN
ncbi:helix-turn-helix transcriptional regulator [Muricauda sp. SCSIO 64092]|uniref:helix-turn-helix domain-containing protein n=1 Tax=Allomuricauda sp. SCSIO 64092 TaxID=2908842 RepID=UPI001FF28B6F|nr:helix-turn-helix transcriptional regulator [Muricauda sp. SCSIO 64092]UOY06541.1 helix-turn-helix transcriptional regulator [Muricauda sp. SCSIO 64092]